MATDQPEFDPTKLRTGLTTGSCATACVVAAVEALFSSSSPSVVSITLPRGEVKELSIHSIKKGEDYVIASTIKDAGDDPDVTHQAEILSQVRLIESGVLFKAGDGVGTVTRTGLPLAVGEPAINPIPRQMISEHLQSLAAKYSYTGGFEITVSVIDGEALALKTMNGRLGIMGGLSILGTTGIVRPFSCAAYIASIHRGIDVARANAFEHIAATTGNRSEKAIQHLYQMDETALIEMGDFAGAVLKYLRHHPVKKLSICGGFGKISKLAAGHMDLHSRASSIDFEFLASIAAELGAAGKVLENIKQANTSIEALGFCTAANIDLATAICQRAKHFADKVIGDPKQQVEVWVINRQGELLAAAKVE